VGGLSGVRYATGHGTGNDFVVIADGDGKFDLTSRLAQNLCDRQGRFGADGVLVLSMPGVVQRSQGVDLVMGYRNADGSAAEMCGNGIRVLVRYAIELGWATGDSWVVLTPSGLVRVRKAAGERFEVEMGQAALGESVVVEAMGEKLPATKVAAPNPHAVALVQDCSNFQQVDSPPKLGPREAFPEGANVEFVEITGPRSARMVIYERGSGLTQSCGTGACAVGAVLAKDLPAGDRPATFDISVPGGELEVRVAADGSVALVGPAVLTSQGELALEWVRANS
jgi:diaminopimelate epimerase